MADEHSSASGHPDMDYAEHEKTYALFTGLAKWGSIVVIGLIILLAVLTL